MKKILILFILAIMFGSCKHGLMSTIVDSYVYGELGRIQYYDFAEYNLPEFSGTKDLADWIESQIDYRSDVVEEFYSPEETLLRGGGDCEDYAILFLNLMHYTMGIKGNLVFVDSDDRFRTIVEGGFVNHAVIEIGGTLISPQTGYGYDYFDNVPVRYRYTFDEVFKRGY